jgi:hypothetical protein
MIAQDRRARRLHSDVVSQEMNTIAPTDDDQRQRPRLQVRTDPYIHTEAPIVRVSRHAAM